jgi:Fur family ferric uptake transcriptional regulator
MKEKLTRNQERVLHFLQHHERAISAQDIYSQLRNSEKSMGLATVYRSLDNLKLQGFIKALTLPNGETVYSVTRADKHHLNCLNCGTTLPIDSCPLHDLGNQLAKIHQFQIYYHTLEFFGLCQQCQSNTH